MPNTFQHDPVVIVAAKRTPTGKFNGYYRNTPAPQLAAATMQNILANTSLSPEQVEAVYLGCVLPAGIGQAPARQAALAAKLPAQTACVTVNKVCGSGMQTVIFAHDALLSHSHQMIFAGGMENMSRAPYLLPQERFGQRLGHTRALDHMLFDGLEDAYEPEKAMGHFAEACAKKYGITREQQDAFARDSILRARHAITEGWFEEEIAPVDIVGSRGEVTQVQQDEGPFTVDPDKIPKLSPCFTKDGTVTAANASAIADGAATLLLMRRSVAAQFALPPLATIVSHYVHAHEPEWFTTAPISAITGLLAKINWDIDQVDLFEINEAFAVVPLVAMQALSIDHERLNVNGGACILGHPLGASGARILVTLIHALRQRRLQRGVASLCIGGGEATALAIEVQA